MKKFLFTLAVLLGAGLFASADVPEFAFSESEISLTPGGDAVTVKVNLSKDAGEDMAGGQLQFGFFNAAHELTNDCKLLQTNIGSALKPNWLYFVPGELVNTLEIGCSELLKDELMYRVLMANLDGTPILMGNTLELCAEAGIEPCMWTLKFAADADWNEEYVTFELFSTPDFYNTWVTPDQVITKSDNEMVLTVKNANYVPAEDLDLTGEIMFGELDEATGKVPVWYEGPEDVTLTVTINGEAAEIVDGAIVLPEYGQYEVYVYANAAGYKEESRMKIFTWTEPVVEPVDLTGEIVINGPDENGVVNIAYTGDEDVTIVVTVNGEEVTPDENGNITVPEGASVIVVTVGGEGYNELTKAVEVVYEPAPEVTEAPVIVVTETDDAVIIDVVGEGEIHVYVNGEEVEVPCTIAKGEEDQEIVITATAQGEDKEISETATKTVVVPAKVEEPVDDPHMVGYWIVLTDLAGEEHWYSMNADPNGDPNWSIMMTLHHQPWDINVPFYFMVNGVRYGAETDMQLPEMGDSEHTIQNPVFAGENNWYVPAGYTYNWGLQFKNGEVWLLVAQGPMTGIEELVAGKEVAGVRYFNMAGQEMQEAAGICIAVTTYTDGTTSTMKVIK